MKIQETTREDGFCVISCKIPSRRVFINLIAGVGSGYDPEDKDGLFHYFEHMLFKGTKLHSAYEISSLLMRHALNYNAVTNHISTHFFVEMVYHKLPMACDILTDMYFNSIFPEEEMEKEKKVILNEISRDNDSNMHLANCALWNSLWNKNPLRNFGVGTPQGIKNISRKDLLDAHTTWYTPTNTTVIAVGNVSHNEVVQEVFSRIPPSSKTPKPYSWSDEYELPPNKQNVIIEKPGIETAIIVIGFKIPTLNYNDGRTLLENSLLNQIIDVILYEQLRENRGLVYVVNAYGMLGETNLANHFTAIAETLPNNVQEVEKLMTGVLSEPLNDLNKFKDAQETFLDFCALEHDGLSLNRIADLIYYRKQPQKPLKIPARFFQHQRKIISSLTLADIENYRKKIIKPEKFVTVVVKPS